MADVFFHGFANYEKGLGKDCLKLTTGGGALIRYMSGTKLPLIEAMEMAKK